MGLAKKYAEEKGISIEDLMEDKDFKEIAFILDITESGAKMRTYRALDRLRKDFNVKIKYDGKD